MTDKLQYNKKTISIDNQVELLESLGLKIKDRQDAKYKLQNIGYFKFKGYCYYFHQESKQYDIKYILKNIRYFKFRDCHHYLNKKYKQHKFKEGTEFKDIYDAYLVDQKIHKIFFEMSNRIETQFKSRLGQFVGTTCGGPLGYQQDFFKNDKLEVNWNKTIKEATDRARTRNEMYISHHNSKYTNVMPIWMLLEMITFGNMSKFFKSMNNKYKKNFCRSNYKNISFNVMENWLTVLTNYRNVCAHNSRSFSKQSKTLVTRNNEIDKDKDKSKHLYTNTIFSAFYIGLILSYSLDFNLKIVNNIEMLFLNNQTIMKEFGFPNNWKSCLIKAAIYNIK